MIIRTPWFEIVIRSRQQAIWDEYLVQIRLDYAVRENERYLQQRDKLIEVLRWYADANNYRREFRSRHGTLVEPAEAIYYDGGQRARDILREVGVTVE